jgi:hypothetical protein
MKIGLFLVSVFFTVFSFAQTDSTKGINFQAIARNSDGSVIPTKDISVRLSIREGAADGKIEYQEIKTASTNIVGLFSVVVGSKENASIVVIGDYNQIDWSTGNKYLQVEIDPQNSINFIYMGVQKLHYVPYALVASSVNSNNVVGLNKELNKKINVSDTATMLANYQKSGIDKASIGLSNVDNTSDMAKPISTITHMALDSKENIINKSINISLDANSDTKYPTVKAVKSYVDSATVGGVSSDTIISFSSRIVSNTLSISSNTADIATLSASLNNKANIASPNFTGTVSGITKSMVGLANVENTSLSSWTGSTNISTVGTITSGAWSATTIDIAHGGTGTNALNGILLGTNGSGLNYVSTAAYGSWYDVVTQTAALANTAYPMLFRNTDFTQGVSIVDNSKITVTRTGKYNIQFSAQLDRASGTTKYVSIWLRKNGIDVPATCTDVTIQGGTAVAATVAAWNFFQNLSANDYIEIMWSSTSTTIQLQYMASRTAPVRPAIPSIILTVQQVY